MPEREPSPSGRNPLTSDARIYLQHLATQFQDQLVLQAEKQSAISRDEPDAPIGIRDLDEAMNIIGRREGLETRHESVAALALALASSALSLLAGAWALIQIWGGSTESQIAIGGSYWPFALLLGGLSFTVLFISTQLYRRLFVRAKRKARSDLRRDRTLDYLTAWNQFEGRLVRNLASSKSHVAISSLLAKFKDAAGLSDGQMEELRHLLMIRNAIVHGLDLFRDQVSNSDMEMLDYFIFLADKTFPQGRQPPS